ncbi:MAG: DUF885 domain-containing protein, partial [Fuerstiella sp.]|nr:DUF885 domain-containing protein [Fuerstiella sp.]
VTAIEASAVATKAALDSLHALDVTKLSPADQLNYRLFEREYKTRVAEYPMQLFLMPLNQRGGIQNENNLAKSLSFDSVRDYQDWIARLNAFPKYMDQTMDLMRRGIDSGMLHPKVVMKRVPAQIRKQLVSQPEDSLYYEPFRTFRVELSAAEKHELREAATAAIQTHILPSYEMFLRFFEEEYLPASYDQVGCWQRPDGQRMYAQLAKKFTTTSLTPQQIHDIGQSEVARIRQEMEA